MRPQLLLAAAGLFTLGALVDLVVGPARRWARPFPYVTAMFGSGCVAAVGVACVGGAPLAVHLDRVLELGSTGLRLDPLAGLALTLTGGLGVAVSAVMISWVTPEGRVGGRGLGAGYLLMLGAVMVIVTAADAFLFLFAWETVTVSFYALAGFTRRHRSQPNAAWATLVVGKAGGAALLFGFLLLAAGSHTSTLAGWGPAFHGAAPAGAYALIVAGFAAKVGAVPTQVWMPGGYSAAPGPVRAGMAGLAVNVGFYGLWRFLGILGAPPTWLAIAVLTTGGATALLGIAFAAVQSDLNRVIAYSSIENGGLILVGYGVALVGAAVHRPTLVAIGLLAASLQVLAHAVAKSGLFAVSGIVESDRGTSQLESLHGIARTHTWYAAAFSAGALTLAGLPPTIGFVSEWFTLEALLQQFRTPQLAVRLGMATAGALVALTAGVAVLCFVRILAFVVGGPRPSGRSGAERGLVGRAGALVLGVACFGLAAVGPWTVRYIAAGLGPVIRPAVTLTALKGPWVLQPAYPDFSILSPSWLFIVLPLAAVAVGAGATLLSGGRMWRVRRVPAWHSATAGVGGADSYSPFGYANPLRHVLANVLGTRKRVVGPADSPPEAGPAGTPYLYEALVVEPVGRYLVRPARVAFLTLVDWSKKLQSGRLGAYVAYMLVTLLAVMIVAAALT